MTDLKHIYGYVRRMHKEHKSKLWELTVRKTTGAKKNSVFPAMSVSSAEEEEEAGGDCEVEKLLSNGDFYTGQWSENYPHGTGKYLWTDGCMYEGEWCRGKTMGRGKFSWPSGATYEGDFKTGFMDGYGTYIGSNGDIYRGYWVMNLKQGKGRKNYANGDSYVGEWRCGVQDGQGKYIWKNGSEYEGEWKNGVISGKGLMLWADGNRYIGSWEDGLPKGGGRFLWVDGSFYVGTWSTDPSEQSGTYYPSGTMSPANHEWDPQEVFSISLKDCVICPGEQITILPSQKALNWMGVEVDFTHRHKPSQSSKADGTSKPKWRRSIDIARGRSHSADKGHERSGGSETDSETCYDRDGDENLSSLRISDVDPRRSPIHPLKLHTKKMKKQGETIKKGHKNYELMLNLQLGIRHSVGRPAPATSLDLKASAFDPKEKIWTKFPPEGSKHTPPHQSCEFKWKDYCPLVFRTLRMLFKVDAGDYMISICGNDALRELSSPGKSGSFFYLTNDDRYMIKTMKKAEVKVLLRMLPAYYNHVRSFENTLVTRFFGLHCVKLTGATQKKVRFVIMGNLFCSEYVIHRRYDLKGSSHGRTTAKPEEEIDENTTLKDLDLTFIFRLQKSWFREFLRQVDRDCEFLEQERIMDYSLLVGLHFRGTSNDPQIEGNGEINPSSDAGQLLSNSSRWPNIRLGINMPARVEQTVRRRNRESIVGDPTGKFYDVVLFFGIIDILQDYDISKKLEHAYKAFHYDPTSISAVDPKLYSKRFKDFIFKVFAEDT